MHAALNNKALCYSADAFRTVEALAARSQMAHKRFMICMNALAEQLSEELAIGDAGAVQASCGMKPPFSGKAPSKQEDSQTMQVLGAKYGGGVKRSIDMIAEPQVSQKAKKAPQCSSCKEWGIIATDHKSNACALKNSTIQYLKVPSNHQQGMGHRHQKLGNITFDHLAPEVKAGECIAVVSNGHVCRYGDVPAKKRQNLQADLGHPHTLHDTVQVYFENQAGWYVGVIENVLANGRLQVFFQCDNTHALVDPAYDNVSKFVV